jgi:cytochrome c oxidase subunit 2
LAPAFDAWRFYVPLAGGAMIGLFAGWQSSLDPHSPQASHLAGLFWFFTLVCAAIWLLVIGALLATLRRRAAAAAPPQEDSPVQMRRKAGIVGACVALTAIILAVFTLVGFYATRSFAWNDPAAVSIKVTGRQWWWQVQYQHHDPSQLFDTANEIHIPVGRPTTLELEAADVIHSFWVPDLMGKQDLIPGRKNYLTIEADRPGLYRGQCAEFCGLEHAHMAILVFAEPPAQFDAWRARQLEAAKVPGAPQRVRGMEVFVHGPCAACHTVNGTDAGGRMGPDLTHFGSRATIAAGLLSNTPENLRRWLDDPQGLKPGNYMPQVPLPPADRTALVAYLEGLK